jgi:hypothetical protein
MSVAPILQINLGGQEILYNQDSKVIILNIHEPFYSAGKILSWPKELGTAAFGINKEILKFAVERKLRLLIRCDTTDQKEYWLNYYEAFAFIRDNKPEYFTHGVWLYLLPWKLFRAKPNFS